MLGDGEALPGGNSGVVVRAGNTVLRPAGPWTPRVHQLMRTRRGRRCGTRPHGAGTALQLAPLDADAFRTERKVPEAMTPETTALLEFFESPEGFDVVTQDFMPEVGGDPQEFGIADVRTVTAEQMVSALQIFVEIRSDLGLFDDSIVAASRSGSADWSAVFALIGADSYLMRGL